MTVPASLFVATNPSVIGVGGAALVLNGMLLTTSARVPIGDTVSFSSDADVADYFGGSSTEAAQAAIYFDGWNGSLQKPSELIFTQYNQNAVSAYLRGGGLGSVSLAELQTFNGSLAVTFDGYTRTAGSVNLSGATSFSNAASIIQTDLNVAISTSATFTAAIAGGVMTVSALSSGSLGDAQTVSGTGVGAGVYITGQLSGSVGGTGAYSVTGTASVGSSGMTSAATNVAVTYDSVTEAFIITSGVSGVLSTSSFATGTLSESILLASDNGGVISQGAASATPSAFMTALASNFSNWATFGTLFDPDNGSGFANKLLFAQWTNGTNNRFAYSAYDVDTGPSTSQPDTGSFGYALQNDNLSGTVVHWNTMDLATLWMGMVASVDFDQVGGRVTFAYKSAGITPTVTDETSFVNLAGNPQSSGSFGNGYNVYAAIGSANANFQNYQRSTISGPFKWSDAYINAIWLSNGMQVDLLNLFTIANAIPFNGTGQGMISTALADRIQQGLLFGAYAPGVLSGAQVSAVNANAGFNIATQLQNQGYFLLIRPASAAVRANRGPWLVTFYYIDEGSVQAINLATVALQ